MSRVALFAVGFALALPSAAWGAYSGTITDVSPTGVDNGVGVTYTSYFTECDEIGYCGWFPFAVEVRASEACYDNDNVIYVGNLQDNSGTQGPTRDSYFPDFNPSKICLFAYHDGQNWPLASYVYTAP